MQDLTIKFQAASFASTLEEAGTAQRAEHEKAYLKSDLNFYGASVPVVRQTAKTFYRNHPKLSHTDLIALVEVLWQSNYHEMRSLGIALLDHYPHLITLEDIGFLEGLLRRMQTWAHVDWIATGAIANLLDRDANLKSTLVQWARDDLLWVRRTAMLALMKRARIHREDFDLFAQFASQMVEEKEFFIRKAIGWVLREVSKKQPEWTYEFLVGHIDRVSGLTLREGARYLPTEQRESLIKKAKKPS